MSYRLRAITNNTVAVSPKAEGGKAKIKSLPVDLGALFLSRAGLYRQIYATLIRRLEPNPLSDI